MANFPNIPRKSLQQIQTSLDDDSIIDMLNSTKLRRYFGVEIEAQQQQHPSRKHRKHKIKQLFNNNQRHKNKKHRHKTRKHQDTKYHPNNHQNQANTPDTNLNSSNITKFKPLKSHKQHKDKYGRSKSVPRIQPLDVIQNPSDHKKLHRLQSFFEKFNNLNQVVIKPIETIARKNSASTTSTNTTISYINTPVTPSLTITRNNIQKHITWRPSLKDIYNDTQLLTSLIAFMERIYCEENILFLQAVQQFKCKIDQYIDSDEKQSQIECSLGVNIKRDIDFQIISIYNAYIVSNAQYQVNLSYDCLMNSLGRREQISTISLHQKREIFDNCVDEVERLIMSSVLSPFYDSAEFAVVAQQRPRSNGMGIGLEYNRNSIKIKKKSKNPIIKLIEKSPIMKPNSKSCNNKYDNDINHIDTQSNDSQDDINHINSPDTDSEIEDLIHNNSLFDDDDIDDPPYPIPYNIKNNTTASINAVSKLVKQMSQSTESLYDFEKKMARTGGSSKSIASAPIKRRKDSGYTNYNSYNSSYNYLSTNSYNNTISPISTTNDTNISSISNTDVIDSIDTRSPISLSQSKSEQFDITNSYCSPEPHNHYKIFNNKKYSKEMETNIDEEHIKTCSDGQIFSQFKIQKLKTTTYNNKPNKKYSNSKTKAPNLTKTHISNKKHKKRLKKKKKKRLAMDDGKIKNSQIKNKIKKLKKNKKISLRKRRKSNNDSDILLMLYRDNRDDKQATVDNANKKNNKHHMV